jgi:hypothetical protein
MIDQLRKLDLRSWEDICSLLFPGIDFRLIMPEMIPQAIKRDLSRNQVTLDAINLVMKIIEEA